jgi:hypothetical protein
MNYIQQLFGLPLGIVFKEDKVDYITALNDSRKTDNEQPFYDFMISQYKKHLNKEIERAAEIKMYKLNK